MADGSQDQDLVALAPDIHWDGKRNTFYLRARGLAPGDTAGMLQKYRRVLAGDPDNTGVRFLLASYLHMAGQGREARAEWEQVVRSAEPPWAAKAAEILGQMPDEPAV